MVTNSFGNKNFRQPMRGLRTHSRVPIFLPLFIFGGLGCQGREFLFLSCSQCVPKGISSGSSECSQLHLNFTQKLWPQFNVHIYIYIDCKGGPKGWSYWGLPNVAVVCGTGSVSRANLCFPLVDSHHKVGLVYNKWNRSWPDDVPLKKNPTRLPE